MRCSRAAHGRKWGLIGLLSPIFTTRNNCVKIELHSGDLDELFTSFLFGCKKDLNSEDLIGSSKIRRDLFLLMICKILFTALAWCYVNNTPTISLEEIKKRNNCLDFFS